MPQDEGTYYLDTDASDVVLGAVLSQEQNGQEVLLLCWPMPQEPCPGRNVGPKYSMMMMI